MGFPKNRSDSCCRNHRRRASGDVVPCQRAGLRRRQRHRHPSGARRRGRELSVPRRTGPRATIENETVVEVILTLERVGDDGTPSGETDVAIVRPSSTIQDCLIYDFVGPPSQLEAQGTIGLRHEHVRPE
jgi:hypothetical protein